MIKKIIIILLVSVSLAYSSWEYEEIVIANASLTNIHFTEYFIFSNSIDEVYRYSKSDRVWENLKIDIDNIENISKVYSHSDSVFVVYDEGIIASDDHGDSWDLYYNYKPFERFQSFAKNDNYLFELWSDKVMRIDNIDFEEVEIEIPEYISGNYISVYSENVCIIEERSSNGFGGGLFLSSDNGDNWNSHFLETNVINLDLKGDSVFTIIGSKLNWSFNFGQTWESIDIDKEYSEIVYFNSNIYLMTFLGEFDKYNIETGEFETVTNKLDKSDMFCNSSLVKNGVVYITTTNGNYEYNPETDELTNNSPLRKGALTFDVSNNNSELLASSFTAGTYVKKDGSDEWVQYSQKLDNWSKSIVRVHYLDGNPYFLDYNRKKFYYEKSEGDWKEITLNSRPTGFGVGLIEDRFYYNDKQSIYHTNDDGATWENIIGPLDEESGNNWWVDCMSIYYNEIYGGTRNGIYHYSIDEQSWSKMTVADSAADSSSVVRFYQDEDKLFAMIDAFGYKLFEFDEEQKVWNKRIEFDSTNVLNLEWYGDTFFWKSGDKLWMTNDDGMTEIDISEGLDDFDIRYTYDISIIDGFIYIAGNDGLYKRPITDYGLTNVSEDVETRNYLYTFPPYPNPANNSINVKFYWDISLPMDVSDIRIYDLTGNELNVEGDLTINKQEQYYGHLVWDCSEVPAGIYIININHGTEERSVKVLVE